MKSKKEQLLDYVEKQRNHVISWKKAIEFLLELKGMKYGKETRGWYSSYFSICKIGIGGYSYEVKPALSYPSPNDNRYLAKISRGVYELRYVK